MENRSVLWFQHNKFKMNAEKTQRISLKRTVGESVGILGITIDDGIAIQTYFLESCPLTFLYQGD